MGGVPAPGTLRLYAANPNRDGAAESQLYLFSGDATSPIHSIEVDAGVALPLKPDFLESTTVFLRIYHFNDLHGHLMRFEPGGEESVLSRVAWQIRSARQECQAKPHTIVLALTAGDDCGGSIFDEIWIEDSHADPIHPGYRLYSKIGIDAAGLGNHDLDHGLIALADAIRRDACFPVLAANLKVCEALSEVCHPAAILVVQGIRIGLMGVVTRAETRLDTAACQIVDPVPVANNLIAAIHPLCDVLILLSHLGYSLESHTVPMLDAGDVELARSLPYGSVHLIVGGHSHHALHPDGLHNESIINGIPIVQAGARGEYLGQVDLTLQEKAITVTDARLIPTASLPLDSNFEENEMLPLLQRVRNILNQPLGEVEDLPDLNTQVLLNNFASAEMALANFITDALVEQMTQHGFAVDFSMIDASALQCGLPLSNPLTFGDCFEMMPYTDTLRLYQMSGRHMLDLLADNALRLDRPDEPHVERGFLQFSRQIRYGIDLGRTRKDARVSGATFQRQAVEKLDTKIFTIATTCFIRQLAALWEANWQDTHNYSLLDLHQFPFTEMDLLLRREIIAYIQRHGGVTLASGAQRDGRLKVISVEESLMTDTV